MLEQNARLVGQFPATMRTFNDSLERFNQTVQRLDRAVTQIETATRTLVVPLERIAAVLDPKLFESLRKEALPALRAATDTQRQVARLQGTVERVVAVASELPGAGILRRLAAAGRDEDVQVSNPKPPPSGR